MELLNSNIYFIFGEILFSIYPAISLINWYNKTWDNWNAGQSKITLAIKKIVNKIRDDWAKIVFGPIMAQ